MTPLQILATALAIPAIAVLVRIYQKSTNAICTSKKRLDGKTAIVTGGTAGMGLEIAKDFARRGARVIVACPFREEGTNAEKCIIEETGNKNVVFKLLDLGSLKSTRRFAEDILTTEERLDLLINNAGIAPPARTDSNKLRTEDGMDITMQVNYYGHFMLTILLLPLLKKSGRPSEPSRIINTASFLHWFGRIDVENMNKSRYYWIPGIQYPNSKTCVVSFTRELSKRLTGAHVVVNDTDPGLVGTGIYSVFGKLGSITSGILYFMFKTPREGAQTAIYLALDEKAGEVSGYYFRNCQPVYVSPLACFKKASAKLWEESVRLVQLTDQELELGLK